MSTAPGVQPARKRRMPKWMKITLAAFAVLFILGAIFGKTPTPAQKVAAAPAPSTTAAPTPTSSSPAAPATYRVTEFVDAGTVKVTGPGGQRTIHIQGIHTPPPNGTGCFTTEALEWAKSTLSGQELTLQFPTSAADSTQASVTLANGSDYAVTAIGSGYAQYSSAVTSTSLQAAESAARAASVGLWAEPCLGNIDSPPVTKAPEPPPAAPVTKAPEPTKAEAAPAPDKPSGSAYYKNCAAAKAAHAAPLHRGDPGYSSKLDRDGDGVACET